MQGARRRPWWVPRTSRATPQTPQLTDLLAPLNPTVAHEQSALPTLRERADFPSFVVVASLLGLGPTASAPPRLRKNLPRSRPRGILRQAPGQVSPRTRLPAVPAESREDHKRSLIWNN